MSSPNVIEPPLTEANIVHAELLAERSRLQAANERLEMALAASGVVGLWDWMVDTDLLHGDANFARIYGLDVERTASGLTMEQYQEFVVADDLSGLRSDIRDTFERGADFLVEYRLAVPGSTLRWVECKGRLIADAEGRPIRFSGTAVDITERKRADEALRASAEAARENAERVQLALSAGAIIGTWVWDIPNDELSVDEGFANAFGIDPALGLRGLKLDDALRGVHPDDKPALMAAIEKVVGSGGAYLHQYRARRRDGAYGWVEANGRVERDAQGAIHRFPGVLVDITARREVENERDRIAAELRSLNANLERRVADRTAERDRMWDASPDLLATLDAEGVIRQANPAWTRILGYEREEVLGRRLADLADGLDTRSDEAPGALVDRVKHKNGEARCISWASAMAANQTYLIGRDVTAEKRRAEVLAETQEALRQSQKMEAVGQLTGGLAHDFNNLLAGISGALELMQFRAVNGQFKDLERYILTAQSGVKRAASLTHRLLAFSRRQTLDPQAADVNRLVSDMHELIQRTVGPAIPVEVVTASGLWPALVDSSQLENALLNLCINARDAMPDGGRITIETANRWLDERAARQQNMEPGQYLSLCVTDSGVGIAPELMDKVFEPFFTTKPLGEGTGLGLSMVYGFAKQSGGHVRIYSELGMGATVCIYLPRHDGPVSDDAAPTSPSLDKPAQKDRTVLVVDDEPMIRMLLLETLDDLGYHALEAADSAAGLRILQSDVAIDLLVSDVGLPGGLNGRQMADAARVKRPDLKVLFITGYAENAAVGNGHLLPGMQVMTKPFEMQALAARIKGLVESQS